MSATSPGQPIVSGLINGRLKLTGEVGLPEAQTQRNQAKKRYLASGKFGIYCSLAGLLFLTPPARASFIGAYSLANFTLTNSDSVGGLSGTNGFAMSPDGGLSVVLTGGNSGSGLAGATNLVINAAASGLVHFQYSYTSLDDQTFDFAGYLLTNNFFELSDTSGQCNGAPCPGMVQFAVSAGQSFGFRVGTMDNLGEPGILTISGFDAPGNSTILPEPGTGPVIIVLFAAWAAARLWRSKRSNRRNA